MLAHARPHSRLAPRTCPPGGFKSLVKPADYEALMRSKFKGVPEDWIPKVAEQVAAAQPNPAGKRVRVSHMYGEEAAAAAQQPLVVQIRYRCAHQLSSEHFRRSRAVSGRQPTVSFDSSELLLSLATGPAAPNVVLLGDAAHAVTPVFGQGANSALESCMVLNKVSGGATRRQGKATAWARTFLSSSTTATTQSAHFCHAARRQKALDGLNNTGPRTDSSRTARPCSPEVSCALENGKHAT